MPKWDTDLIWELSDADYKQLKTKRAAIKIECFNTVSGSKASGKKLGYFVVPLKEIRVNDHQSEWVTLLQPAKPCRPELQLRLRVMRSEDYMKEVKDMQQVQAPPPAPTPVQEVVNLSTDVIELGTAGKLSVKLSFAVSSIRGLDSLTRKKGAKFYVFYQLFDSDYRSELFQLGGQPRLDRKAFLLSTSRDDVLAYFAEPLDVYLCSGATALGVAQVPVKDMLQSWFSSSSKKTFASVETYKVRPVGNVQADASRPATVTVSVEMEENQMDDSPPVVVVEESNVSCVSPARPSAPIGAMTKAAAPSPGHLMASPIRSSNEVEVSMVESDYTLTDAKKLSVARSAEPPRNAPRQIVEECTKLFKMQIEVTCLKNLAPSHVLAGLTGSQGLASFLENPKEEVWLYTRFEYPLLCGSAHIFSNPTAYVRKTNDGRSATIIQKPELGGSVFAFEFAMSERNIEVAMEESCVAVEIWRMAHPPKSVQVKSTSVEDELVGVAVVPLKSVLECSKQVLGDGESVQTSHSWHAVHPHSNEEDDDKEDTRGPCIGHAEVRLQLRDLGAFDGAKSREQQVREQLDMTRAKLEEMWEECQKERKRADKLETRLLVAEFEEQVREGQDREDYQRARQAHVQKLRDVESKLKAQHEINQECIAALEETERTALSEQRRRMQLEKENEQLRAMLASRDTSVIQEKSKPVVKRVASMSSPLLRKVMDRSVDGSQLAMSPGSKRSIVSRSLNHSLLENSSPNVEETF